MKKNSYNMKSAWLATWVLALTLPFGLSYAAKHKTPPPPANKSHITPYWAISSVDTNSIILQKSDGSTNLTLTVTSATKITTDGKPAKLVDLQNGMKVTFIANGGMCASLDAVAPPAAPEKKKAKKKNK